MKNLIKVYYSLDQGIPIDHHLELIRIHDSCDIYISRKALKHFVESRKKEMIETRNQKEICDKLCFAVKNVIFTYIKYDRIEQSSLNRLIYIKYFKKLRNSSLGIVVERVEDRSEICSIHFKKHKKPP